MFEAASTIVSDDMDWIAPSTSTGVKHVQETAAYGACSSPGCHCRGFAGSGDLCSNCGHQYDDHL